MKTKYLVFYSGGPLFASGTDFDPKKLIFIPIRDFSIDDRDLINNLLGVGSDEKKLLFARLEMVEDGLRSTRFYNDYINSRYPDGFNSVRLIGCLSLDEYQMNNRYFVLREVYFSSDVIDLQKLDNFLTRKFRRSIYFLQT